MVLSNKAWTDLVRINKWVNENVKPMTDLDHWGVVEKWSYPDDGYGDCEDYVLLKRRMLMEAGWPREALLITVVRDKKGDGHAVLTVKTDKGEFILDNQNEDILLWSETSYRFVKRQSQTDPNRWVSLGDPRPTSRPRHRAEHHALNEGIRVRDPGHVPTPPRPQTGFARGRPSPTAGRTFFGVAGRYRNQFEGDLATTHEACAKATAQTLKRPDLWQSKCLVSHAPAPTIAQWRVPTAR